MKSEFAAAMQRVQLGERLRSEVDAVNSEIRDLLVGMVVDVAEGRGVTEPSEARRLSLHDRVDRLLDTITELSRL